MMFFQQPFSDYIQKEISESLLLKVFAGSLFDYCGTIEHSEIQEAAEHQRSYKDVAISGYLAHLTDEQRAAFVKGKKWLEGRQFDESDDILADDVALLGLACGLRALKEDRQDWFKALLALKSRLSSRHAAISQMLLCCSSDIPAALDPQDEISQHLAVFSHYFLNRDLQGVSLPIYFNRVRKMAFPYFNIIFLDLISVYNLDRIIQDRLLFDLELVRDESIKYRFIRNRIQKFSFKLASFFTFGVIGALVIVGLGLFAYWFGRDPLLWDRFEPSVGLLGLDLPLGFAAIHYRGAVKEWITQFTERLICWAMGLS